VKATTKLTHQQAAIICDALAAMPQMQPAVAWAGSYEDFLAFVRDVGLTLDRVPRWPSGTAVFVAGHPERGIYLKRLKRREIEHYNKLDAAGMSELGMMTGDDLDDFIHLKIVAIDAEQAKRGRRKWRRLAALPKGKEQ
jgi:hypothetical protein